MRELNLKSKQRGVFSIEFSIIAVVFSLLLVFSGDVIIKLSVKGKLDRLSYSLVNIIKERTQLYPVNEDDEPTEEETAQKINTEVSNLYTIATNSLTRSMSSFNTSKLGIWVEEIIFINENKTKKSISIKQGFNCTVEKELSELDELLVVSTWGKNLDLYRVTLCYDTDNWIGDKLANTFTTVSSSSVMVGR